MRLTLRTMLAYLDDILEPEDNEDIAKKIEESEFASELVHRTRDSMRRLRLGVPPVVGKGLATDPNTVAEYLDNTLATDRVAEFEKICLESDVHLAEVASCHQILTLVLGEPAEIDNALRQRMYQVASQVEAPPIQATLVQPVVSAVIPPNVQPARRLKPEVPEYLRESRPRWWPVAAAVLVGALLTGGALVLLGPQWRGGVAALDAQDEAATQGEAAPIAADVAADTTVPDSAGPAPTDATAPDATTPAPAPNPNPTDLPGTVDDAPPAPLPADDPSKPAGDQPASEVPAPDVPADSAPPDSVPADRATVAPGVPMPKPPLPKPGAVPAEGVPDLGLPPDPESDQRAPRKAAEPAAADDSRGPEEAFGRYTSKREVLLKFDSENGIWKRLPAMAPLAKGDRLLSLPLFRPSISLSTSITIQTDGAAQLELIGWTDEGVPIVAVEFGRLLMMTVGKAGNAIQLKLDDQQPQLTFVDAESTVALEVARILPPGKDPEAGPAPLSVDLYATSGSVRIRQGDAPVDLQAPARRALFGAGIEPPGEVPAWVTSEALSEFDRRAATTLEPLLPADQFISLILKELTGDRRREVRSLAIRSGACLGNFDACTEALAEKDEKTLWSTYVDELRAAIARSPETAAQVRTSFDKQRGADGAALFRMLWGYTADDLKDRAAAELVDGLNHDSLDHRVLAFWNLQHITGLPTYGYSPGDLTKPRASKVNVWKEKLRQGKIVPRAVAAAGKPKSAPAKGREKP